MVCSAPAMASSMDGKISSPLRRTSTAVALGGRDPEHALEGPADPAAQSGRRALERPDGGHARSPDGRGPARPVGRVGLGGRDLLLVLRGGGMGPHAFELGRHRRPEEQRHRRQQRPQEEGDHAGEGAVGLAEAAAVVEEGAQATVMANHRTSETPDPKASHDQAG